MARQAVNNGSFVDDPSAENLYAAFEKVNANSLELYQLFTQGEFKTNGILVYPMGAVQTIAYNADGSVNTMTCSYLAKTWTLTYVYDVNGNVTQLQSTDGTTNWTRTMTYNADGSLATDGGWV